MSTKLTEYTLYYSPYCPFCIRVLNTLQDLDVEVSLKDTGTPEYRQELIQGGGRQTVPCLLHPDGKWQYESADIMDFFKKKVS